MAEKKDSKRYNKNYNDTQQLLELGKVQPQALDFEAAVIGACLIEKDAIGIVSDILDSDSFYDTKHQVILQQLKNWRRKISRLIYSPLLNNSRLKPISTKLEDHYILQSFHRESFHQPILSTMQMS